MVLKIYPHIPSYSSSECQIQILQLLEHEKSVNKILVLGAMLGAYAAAFAGTFPNASIVAVDRWLGEDSGLDGIENSMEKCSFFTKDFGNIRLLKLDYTQPSDIKKLDRDFDFIYIGGPITTNVAVLLSHFDSRGLIVGCMYSACETDPITSHFKNCKTNPERATLKRDLISFANQNNRRLLAFGCYNWMLLPPS